MFSDLELEYDQFNGSVTDLAEQPGNESMESMVGETTNETVESTEDVLVVPKQRDSDKYPLRIASHFTASKKVKSPEETHLDELSKMKGEFAKKAYKIGKEIAFLEVLVPQMEDGVELDKLKYAMRKLEERKEEIKRQEYNLSIRINRLEKKVYGEQGYKVDYWVRGVSS